MPDLPPNRKQRTRIHPSSASSPPQDVSLVVLDEVHYLGDPGRGSVWEEVIINLPAHIRLLSMSATVRNPEDLGYWIAEVHGPCDTVKTSFRPVPLAWRFCQAVKGEARVVPLLDARGRSINPLLLPPARRFDDGGGGAEGWSRWDGIRKNKAR